MTSQIIDTNCLISYVTDRNPSQNIKISDIFERVSSLEQRLVVISNVITEFVYVLTSVYTVSKEKTSQLVYDLLDNPGVEYHHGYFPSKIFELWPNSIKEYGDAVITAATVSLHDPIITFDQTFSRELDTLGIEHTLL